MAINYDRNLDEKVRVTIRKRHALELSRVLQEILNDRPLREMLSVDEFREELLNEVNSYIKIAITSINMAKSKKFSTLNHSETLKLEYVLSHILFLYSNYSHSIDGSNSRVIDKVILSPSDVDVLSKLHDVVFQNFIHDINV